MDVFANAGVIELKSIPRHFEVTLYISEGAKFPFVPVIYSVSKVLEGSFSGEPFVVSLPIEGVAGFPAMLWPQAGVGSFSMIGSKAELSFDWKEEANSEQRVTDVCSRLARCLAVDHSIPIDRIAVSIRCAIEDGISVDDFLEQYGNSKRLGAVDEIEMSWKTHTESESIAFDRWVRYRSEAQSRRISEVVIEASTPRGPSPLAGEATEQVAKMLIPMVWREAIGIIKC